MKKICAIYTRKSSEERLDQDFNSLDAQRESCEAYIKSQKSEGWVSSSDEYSDGGFSGGTLDRPALHRLMNDIRAAKVHIVVVYKIDRLTRSLMDFAKLVEVFDQYGVTFVSVTQSFNTTTSMGRLTLNVLLSFAQFEREIAGERIRDKIAASKQKGMWMGAPSPIGYSIENRQLVVNSDEAPVLKMLFARYLELGCVKSLKQDLDRKGIKTPQRLSKKGNIHGGLPFSRGNLYQILKNPVYLGQIRHKQKVYDGLHDALIDAEQWQAVQAMLESHRVHRTEVAKQRHLLVGILFDAQGTLYTPTFTSKGPKRYRYYISQDLLQYRDHPSHILARLPADEIETTVLLVLRKHIEGLDSADPVNAYFLEHWDVIPDQDRVQALVGRVTVHMNTITLNFKPGGLGILAKEHLGIAIQEPEISQLEAPYHTRRGDKGTVIIDTPERSKDIFLLPPAELKRLVQGIAWSEDHFKGESIKAIARRMGCSAAFVSQTIFKSFKTLQAAY